MKVASISSPRIRIEKKRVRTSDENDPRFYGLTNSECCKMCISIAKQGNELKYEFVDLCMKQPWMNCALFLWIVKSYYNQIEYIPPTVSFVINQDRLNKIHSVNHHNCEDVIITLEKFVQTELKNKLQFDEDLLFPIEL